MADLHVFHNDYEWVVAESVEDCERAMFDSIGATYSVDDEIEWYQLDDDSTLKVWMAGDDIAEPDQAGAEVVEKTCQEWAEQFGRGFLASTEY